MNLQALRTALEARGFDHLTPTEQDRFLNYSYRVKVCTAQDWPFLEATATGAAPLEIADLRTIESVVITDTSARLSPSVRQELRGGDTDLSETGSPEFYYLTGGDTVNVHPVSTDSLSVSYWKRPGLLVEVDDDPIVPEEFHELIVDGAVLRAYETSNEYEARAAARAAFAEGMAEMVQTLILQQHDASERFVSIDNATDA